MIHSTAKVINLPSPKSQMKLQLSFHEIINQKLSVGVKSHLLRFFFTFVHYKKALFAPSSIQPTVVYGFTHPKEQFIQTFNILAK